MRLLAVLLLAPLSCLAEPHEQEIQRSLIQRDQQSAEFSKPILENLHGRQMQEAGRPLLRLLPLIGDRAQGELLLGTSQSHVEKPPLFFEMKISLG